MSVPKAAPASSLDAKHIIYFDGDIVVADKPAGVMSVPHRESEETETFDRLVLNYLRAHVPDKKLNRASLGVVHRIDKETSGLMAFTRTFAAQKILSGQFREHSIERKYLAIVHGHIQPQTIRSRLIRQAANGIRGSTTPGQINKGGEELGRKAVTLI